MAIVFFIAFLLIGNSVTKTWIQSFDNAGIILGYLWTCLTMAIAVYAFIRRQRIEQWWFRRAQFSGTGEELVNIAKQVDAIVIPVSMHPTQPKWIINCMKPTDVAFLYTDKTKDIALRIVNDFKGTIDSRINNVLYCGWEVKDETLWKPTGVARTTLSRYLSL